MAFFGAKKQIKPEEQKKQDTPEEQQGNIIGFTKPKKFFFFKMKSKPIYGGVQTAQNSTPQNTSQTQTQGMAPAAPQSKQTVQTTYAHLQKQATKPSSMQMYFASVAAKHKGLESALRAQGVKQSPYEFIRRMFIYSAIITTVVTLLVGTVMVGYGLSPILALLLGVACFFGFFNKFVQYPMDRSKVVGKEIEKDILFAARDLVISMRSGMPLYNAMTAVSTGYGAASLEFAKIVELVQLGSPIEQALDDVCFRSQSKTFKRLMLQATVSLKAGADVVGALQGVLDEVMQERVIELRRYGQRLNALAMFYMLFGVIFPSMGIAVAAILTTFINIFSITESTLLFALVAIFFLQIVFLNIMRSSRPSFAM